MKKILAFVLALVLCAGLCACGQQRIAPAAGQTIVTEKTVEVPVIPEEYKKYQKLIDALEAGDYDGAQQFIDGLKPEPEPEPELPPIKQVEITKDNFFDYFEYLEFPADELSFHRTRGLIDAVTARTGFYLKPEYRIAAEKLEDCMVEAEVKYGISWFYAGNKGINVDPEKCTYDITLKANDITDQQEALKGAFLKYPDGTEEYVLWFSHGARLTKDRNSTTLVIAAEGVELVSASGTLYLGE